MKNVRGVIVKDIAEDKFFAFVKQYPGVCAQADTVEEVREKINAYFKDYVTRIMNRGVEMDTEVISY